MFREHENTASWRLISLASRRLNKVVRMVRKAKPMDVRTIQRILGHFASKGKLLNRSLSDLYTHLRDTFVYEDPENGWVVGCCCLSIIWEDLAEIRSLAVVDFYQGGGIGHRLVDACIEEARELGIKHVFVLTYETKFFENLGFRVVDKSVLPHKIWKDCLDCTKFPDCDEVAMMLEMKNEE
jgi:amino-acid N-acetyltransferase